MGNGLTRGARQQRKARHKQDEHLLLHAARPVASPGGLQGLDLERLVEKCCVRRALHLTAEGNH